MTHEQLTEILIQHKLWLGNEGGQRADLRGANLIAANLYRADLYGADLYGADLDRADLRGAYLRGALGIMQLGPMPTSGRMVFFVQHESAIMAQAGCFWGTIDELEQAVKAKHNCPMYLGIIALVRQQWKPIHNQ